MEVGPSRHRYPMKQTKGNKRKETKVTKKTKEKSVSMHSLPFFCFLGQSLRNIVLDRVHQRIDGDERATQRLGFQDAFQLLHLGWVNVRVLRRRFVGFKHPGFGSAPADFTIEGLHEIHEVNFFWFGHSDSAG